MTITPDIPKPQEMFHVGEVAVIYLPGNSYHNTEVTIMSPLVFDYLRDTNSGVWKWVWTYIIDLTPTANSKHSYIEQCDLRKKPKDETLDEEFDVFMKKVFTEVETEAETV